MRIAPEKLPTCPGGWFDYNLPSRDRTHMFRGHGPPAQTSKANAIVSSNHKRTGLLCEDDRAQGGLIFPRVIALFRGHARLSRLRMAAFESQFKLVTAAQPKHRRCGPLRVHPKAAAQLLALLSRRALATIPSAVFLDSGRRERWFP